MFNQTVKTLVENPRPVDYAYASFVAEICKNHYFSDLVKQFLPNDVAENGTFVFLSDHVKDIVFSVTLKECGITATWVLTANGWDSYLHGVGKNHEIVLAITSALENVGLRNAFYAHLCEDLFFWAQSFQETMVNNILRTMRTVREVDDRYLNMCYRWYQEDKDRDITPILTALKLESE